MIGQPVVDTVKADTGCEYHDSHVCHEDDGFPQHASDHDPHASQLLTGQIETQQTDPHEDGSDPVESSCKHHRPSLRYGEEERHYPKSEVRHIQQIPLTAAPNHQLNLEWSNEKSK